MVTAIATVTAMEMATVRITEKMTIKEKAKNKPLKKFNQDF